MSGRKLIFIIMMSVVVLPAYGAGQADGGGNDPAGQLSKGIELYNEQRLEESASAFSQAASSENPETAAAAYYNQGTVQAQLAGRVQDPAEKRRLLEESFRSLKRAAELGRLPAGQQKDARRNMELVREQLSELPESPSQGQDKQQDKDGQQPGTQNQDGQQGQQGQQGQPQDDQSDGGQSGQNKQDASSPQQMLRRQRELSDRTEKGEGGSRELAEEQKKLQKESEDAGLNEAALNQAGAAKALSRGDMEKAVEYQKAAEQALAGAAGQGENGELDDILNQEAENEMQRNRLDKMGGITDAERNW